MKYTTLIIIAFAALVSGVMVLAPMGESKASGYMYQYSPYQTQYNYSPYGSNYGYGYSTGVPAGWRVVCPTGYTYTGSVCLWQGASYGYNYGGGYPYNYNNYLFNNPFFTGQYGYPYGNYGYNTGSLDVELEADDRSVDEGDRVELTWDVDGNATYCYASNSRNDSDWNGYVDEDGDSDTVRPDRDTTYYIRCWNGAYSVTDSVTVRVDEDDDDDDDIRVTVWADDTHIDDGDSTRIRWDVDGDADRCDASNSRGDNDFEGRIDEDGGSITVRPDRDTTYTVECENGDSDEDSVTVYVD